MHKILRITYLYLTTAVAFAATFAPAIIRADVEPQPPVSAPVSTAPAVVKPLSMRITAYSSSPDETDSTPLITASGLNVHDGIVATNVLPFGTKIKIPALFGDKVFTVEDRMNRRMKNVVDVWMPTKAKALRFGVGYASVMVLQNRDISEK
jgi:3D (Asp-Asp-Asp) domain-containing protein